MLSTSRLKSRLLTLGFAALFALPLLSCGGGGDGGGGGGLPGGCGCLAPGAAAGVGNVVGTPMTAAEIALCEGVLAQVNAERAARGGAPLAWHVAAANAAYGHSGWMMANNLVSHEEPPGCTVAAVPQCFVQRLAAQGLTLGVDYSGAGENVAGGQPTAQDVMCGVSSWMLSAGHCANILGDFTHIGIAAVQGGPLGVYWTQVFLKIP